MKWKDEGIPFREHYQCMVGRQFALDLPRQLPEETFHPITANRDAEPLTDDNTDAGRPTIGYPTNQDIKTPSGQTPTVLLHVFDVTAGTKKVGPISSTLRHRPAHRRRTAPSVRNSAEPLRDALGRRPCLRKTRG